MPDQDTQGPVARQENPAWRAYALMAWKELQNFGHKEPVLDEQGEPVLGEDGTPKTEWRSFNIEAMNERTVHVADFLYAAEIDAEARRIASAEQPRNGDDG